MKKIINLKSFLIFFAAFLMIFALSSCQGDDSSSSDSPSTPVLGEASLEVVESYDFEFASDENYSIPVTARNGYGELEGIIASTDENMDFPVFYNDADGDTEKLVQFAKKTIVTDTIIVIPSKAGKIKIFITSESGL